MRTRGAWITCILLLAVLLTGFLLCSSKRPFVHVRLALLSGQGQTTAGNAVNAKSVVDEVYNAVPDGGTVSYNDFAKKVRQEVADFAKLARVTSLSRKGDHFVLDCNPGTAYSTQGISIVVKKQLEFDVKAGKNSAEFSGVSGISAELPQGLGSARVTDAKVELDANGSITVSGNVRIDAWSLTLPFNFTIDSKPVNKP